MNALNPECVCKVKFEDLIGARGGAKDDIQLITILNIANFLDISISQDKIRKIRNTLWGKSSTFRKGIIGDWKNYFNQEHIQLYKEKYGYELIKLGYENDLNW